MVKYARPASVACRSTGAAAGPPVFLASSCAIRETPDSVAGVRGLEVANVVLRNAGPNSLVFQKIFVLETFRKMRKG
jgi:hypothetical protein